MSSVTSDASWRDEELRSPQPPSRRMSENQYLKWMLGTECANAEWVDGEVLVMKPMGFAHNDLNAWLATFLRCYVERRDLGIVAIQTFTRFSKPRRQIRGPDIGFISKERRHIVQKIWIDGAPDLIIEIVSDDSDARDWREKYIEYEKAGVREYWVVDPFSRSVEAYALSSAGRYERIAEADDRIASTVVAGWYLRPQWLWSEPRVNVLDLLAELGIR